MPDQNKLMMLLQQAGYDVPMQASYADRIGPEAAMVDEYNRMTRQGMQPRPTQQGAPLMQEQVPQRMPLMPAAPRRPMPQEMPAAYSPHTGGQAGMSSEYNQMQRQGVPPQRTAPSYQPPLMQEEVPQRGPLQPAMRQDWQVPRPMPASVARQGGRVEQLTPYQFQRT